MADGEGPLPVVLGDTLEAPPTDGITRLRFSTSDTLLTSSWDKSVRLHDFPRRQLRAVHTLQAPVMDCCFHDDAAIYTVSLDGCVQRVNWQTSQSELIGSHTAGARCVEFLNARGLLVSGGWDSTLRLWDPRQGVCVRSTVLPGRVYAMATAGDRLVVGTSSRHVLIYDVRRIDGTAEQQRESSLKYQTRCLAASPDGRGYALGSVEGRVAIEFYDTGSQAQALKYAFKCHRRPENGVDVVFPVHAMAFHPTYGTFASGGGDGVVSMWDGANKKRLSQVSRYPTSVSALAFNGDGMLLAIASSYVHDQGEKDAPADQVYVRNMQDAEVRPKARLVK